MLTYARRGACPTLSEPMPTGDGLLARIVVLRTIPLAAFAAICAAAGRHGSGVIEVTARGNLQVRGLTEDSKDRFAAEVEALHLQLANGVPITLNPLAGLEPGEPGEPADVAGIAAELDRALAASPFVANLGPKVSVAIDGGGAIHLDALAADLRLTLIGPEIDRGRSVETGDGQILVPLRPGGSAETIWRGFRIAVGGDARTAIDLGGVEAADAVAAAVRLLGLIAARGREARASNILRDEGPGPFRSAIADLVVDTPAPGLRAPAETLRIHHLRDGTRALGVALPFGHAQSDQFEALTSEARGAGATGLRLAPSRALLFVGLASMEGADMLRLAATRLGFIVDADDRRRHIAACPGAPCCASAALSTRELAPSTATSAAALLDGSFALHLSGCAKGCAHRGRSAVTLVGIGDEVGLVLDGGAHDVPCARIPRAALTTALTCLAREVAAARRSEETAARALSRLGAQFVACVIEEAVHG